MDHNKNDAGTKHESYDEPYTPKNFHDDSNFWMRAGDFWDQFMETLGPSGLLIILALIGVWILKIFW